MDKKQEFIGVSSTGSKHGLLIEASADGARFTVTGANGKRHAAVKFPPEMLAAIMEFLATAKDAK